MRYLTLSEFHHLLETTPSTIHLERYANLIISATLLVRYNQEARRELNTSKMSVAAIFEYHNIVNYGTFVASSLQMLSLLVMFIFSWGPQIALAGTLNPLWIQQWGRPQNNRKLHSLKLWCRGLAALFFHGLEVCSFSFVIVLLREQRKLEGLSPGSPWITVCCWSWLVAVGIYFFHFWWTACAILPIMNMGARQYYRLHLDFDHTIPEGEKSHRAALPCCTDYFVG